MCVHVAAAMYFRIWGVNEIMILTLVTTVVYHRWKNFSVHRGFVKKWTTFSDNFDKSGQIFLIFRYFIQKGSAEEA